MVVGREAMRDSGERWTFLIRAAASRQMQARLSCDESPSERVALHAAQEALQATTIANAVQCIAGSSTTHRGLPDIQHGPARRSAGSEHRIDLHRQQSGGNGDLAVEQRLARKSDQKKTSTFSSSGSCCFFFETARQRLSQDRTSGTSIQQQSGSKSGLKLVTSRYCDALKLRHSVEDDAAGKRIERHLRGTGTLVLGLLGQEHDQQDTLAPSIFSRSINILSTVNIDFHTASSKQPTTSSNPASSSRAHRFWTSDDPLLKSLRRRQESYRLRQVGDSARKRSDRIEAISLAKSEIRWVVQHVRKQHPPSKSALDRNSRRQLISMAVQMTRHNVPLSYLLGSVPFGALPQELTIRPPILLPRPETEHWATEVVNALDSLSATQLEKVRIVDLCTGSGCIALLIADALRSRLGVGGSWRVVACDRSPQAIQLAQENAVKLGFSINEAGSNLHIVQADVFDNADMDRLASLAGGAFDLIVSNPPYIPRREWNNLSAEVKEHEDPAALIGERDVASHGSDAVRVNGDERKNFLDRHGLAFHERLAQLLYRPTFSTSTPPLPRLVAEYGKGQQRQVERLHAELKAPRDRLPRLVRVEGHLVVVGLGNATTHPLTRHSIGQVVLEPLLAGLVEQDRLVRARLREVRDELEKSRLEAVAGGCALPGWEEPVPRSLPVYTVTQSFNSTKTLPRRWSWPRSARARAEAGPPPTPSSFPHPYFAPALTQLLRRHDIPGARIPLQTVPRDEPLRLALSHFLTSHPRRPTTCWCCRTNSTSRSGR